MGTTYVDDGAFAGCVNVKKIVFSGDLPTILSAFIDVKADAWYPSGNETWTTDALLNYGGSLTWHAMCREHSYGKWTPVVDATCTESGIDEHTCSFCKWTEQRISEPTFGPNGELQRAQFVTMLWRAAGEPEPTSTENPFSDVKEGDFFYKAVLWAIEKGITKGISETEFGISSNCNRAQTLPSCTVPWLTDLP